MRNIALAVVLVILLELASLTAVLAIAQAAPSRILSRGAAGLMRGSDRPCVPYWVTSSTWPRCTGASGGG